ncbi:MAG: phosphatase PAP2 family protein [Chthoniobacterales bacterium]
MTVLRVLFQQPMTSDARVQTRFLPGTIVCCLLLAAAYVALIGTDWGHQLDDSAYVGREVFSSKLNELAAVLLTKVGLKTITGAAGILFLISVLRRSVLVGLGTLAGFSGALVGAEILKEILPWHALVPEDSALGEGMQFGTFPSGHVTIATTFGLGLLLVLPARWRSWLAPMAGALSSLFAASVLFAGWHRASDALGALAWSGVCMNLAAAIVVRLKGRPAISKPRPGLSRSLIVGMVVLVAFFLAAAAAPQSSVRGLPFLLVSGVIIASSFTLTAWYSRQLEAVDFR